MDDEIISETPVQASGSVDSEKEKLRQKMSRIPNRICLTSDAWTASTTEGYICLTAHFVDENWRLVSKILNFCRMIPPHTGTDMEAVLFNSLKQWGIDKKIFPITLDNASANDNMQNILKTHLCKQNSLLCDGEYFHVHCSAHILNLIVQEGLKVAAGALFKIRESVKYVKASDGRMMKFKDCVQQAEIEEGVGLKSDVPTRWNFTYMMLESEIKFEKAFDILSVVDGAYKDCPTNEEWSLAKKMCEFLKPFYETTNLILGSSYPTSNLMKMKFDKYWKDYSTVLAFGAILDP
ncbi:zinc finger BED domain-containing protein RICESLEEPER 2-like [Arachis hypogaea]|uniref:zinc finger BED domain-containing protein RICESLEEPER 2-like n=1 Tax=Arachis hypogaea TaxID=3818 RepID=UPI000DEC20CE|nr:zinc finger BED domain-containing protein RICESLEEPER 2-like [Arachis hypogaea]